MRQHDYTYLPPHPNSVEPEWCWHAYLPTPTPRRTNAGMGLPTYPHRSAGYYYPTLEKKRNPVVYMHISLITTHCNLLWPHKFKFNDVSFKIVLKFEFMWPQQVTMCVNQENMHVHYSNTLINILIFTETHQLTCYRPTMKQSVWGDFRCPSAHARMTSRV